MKLPGLPPGFRFRPTDMELVVYYLNRKIVDPNFNPPTITETDIYAYSPTDLIEMHRSTGEDKWYFFSPRQRRYQKGKRPSREAGGGFWKQTGSTADVKDRNCKKIGSRNVLTFYEGKPPGSKDTKTNWIMYEYLNEEYQIPVGRQNHSRKLDDWVLCRIYYHKKGKNAKNAELLQGQSSTGEQDQRQTKYARLLQGESSMGKQVQEQDQRQTKYAQLLHGETRTGEQDQRKTKYARLLQGESSMGKQVQEQDQRQTKYARLLQGESSTGEQDQTKTKYARLLQGESSMGKQVQKQDEDENEDINQCQARGENEVGNQTGWNYVKEARNEAELQRYLYKGKMVENCDDKSLNTADSDKPCYPSSLEFPHQFPNPCSASYYGSYVTPLDVLGPNVPISSAVNSLQHWSDFNSPNAQLYGCQLAENENGHDLQDIGDQILNISRPQTNYSFVNSEDLNGYTNDFDLLLANFGYSPDKGSGQIAHIPGTEDNDNHYGDIHTSETNGDNSCIGSQMHKACDSGDTPQ